MGAAGKYKVVLNSDDKKFDGQERLDAHIQYSTCQEDWDDRHNSLMIYIPSRVALVLCRCNHAK